MEIDDKFDDRDEQRRLERSRDKNRKDLEWRQQRESMKTFEAKLSEKLSHDIAAKEAEAQQTALSQKPKKEEKSLIDKLIGATKGQEVEDDGVEADETQKRQVKDLVQEDHKNKEDEEWRLAEPKTKKSVTETGEEKKSERSGDGHKRIEEQPQQQEGGGSGQGASSQGKGQSGQSFGSDSQDGSKQDQKQSLLAAKTILKYGLHPVKDGGFGSHAGYQRNPQAFTPKDLDDIVVSVRLATQQGRQELTVELDNAYFDGLKVQVARMDEGVVLKFICPNVSVRSTFIKYRPQVYERLKSKGIAVARIDVI